MQFVVIQKPKPKYRGVTRVVFAVVNAETKTGAVRAFRLAVPPDKGYSAPDVKVLMAGVPYWAHLACACE